MLIRKEMSWWLASASLRRRLRFDGRGWLEKNKIDRENAFCSFT